MCKNDTIAHQTCTPGALPCIRTDLTCPVGKVRHSALLFCAGGVAVLPFSMPYLFVGQTVSREKEHRQQDPDRHGVLVTPPSPRNGGGAPPPPTAAPARP